MVMSRARAAMQRAAPGPASGQAPGPASGGAAGPASGAEPSGDPDSSRFLRGVAIGALVGAAIAGSTVWQRRRVRGRIRRELIEGSEQSGS
jgi:hypothetical protein